MFDSHLQQHISEELEYYIWKNDLFYKRSKLLLE